MIDRVKLIECPRDAMQGWHQLIPVDKKIDYINSLLRVGFDTIDFGSFVSPAAIPQMADTKDVLVKLKMQGTNSKLLAIIANVRGAEEAIYFEQITYLGFPFSLSETFQKRNTNSTIEEAFEKVERIHKLCVNNDKQLVIYLSMGFGNPYGDPFNEDIVHHWAKRITDLGVNILSVADTVGVATPLQVSEITSGLIRSFPKIEIGVHLHSTTTKWEDKINAALEAGCKRFDGALKGIGGCPMSGNQLVGNINTEWMIHLFQQQQILNSIDENALNESIRLADEIFT